jgi:type I restriction enzyme, S subunit
VGKYQGYEKYKDSGVEWLGEIPEHWETKRLKYLIIDLESGVSVNATDNPCEEDEFGILKTSCVYTYSFVPEENKKIWDSELDRATINPIKNSLIISRMNTPDLVGASGYVDKDYPNLFLPDRLWQTIVNPRIEFSIKYLSFIFVSFTFRKKITSLATGSSPSMKNISKGDILGLLSPFPPLDEQESIAYFLDRKTSQIDTLIAKKSALLEKLDEKRSALISHAVTKGLDRNVPMKYSGVEWLGDIPEHWELKRLKFVVSQIIDAEHRTALYDDGEYLVVRTANVRSGKLLLENGRYTNEFVYKEWTVRAVPEKGDILFTREAPPGEACLVPEVPIICLGQRMVLFKFDKNQYNGFFLLQSLYSGIADEFIKSLSLGSTVAHFNLTGVQARVKASRSKGYSTMRREKIGAI